MVIMQRGQIVTPDRARQIRDFSGLLFGKITPTDIDALIEYHNKGYIIIEVKLSGAPILDGQRKALARLTDILWRTDLMAICLIATHNTTDVAEPIDVANAIVRECRYHGRWKRLKNMPTVREMSEWCIREMDRQVDNPTRRRELTSLLPPPQKAR